MAMEQAMIGNEPTMILTSGASGRVNALLSLRAFRSLVRLINLMISVLLVLFLGPFRGRRRCVAVVSPEGKEERQEVGGGGGVVRKCGGTTSGGAPLVRVPAAIIPRRAVAAVLDQEVAARRAMAVQRVVEDKDENSVREFSLFATSRGVTLFTQSWTPVSVTTRGVVVLLHGLNEHSDRYSNFAKELNANGFKVYGMDWIGLSILIWMPPGAEKVSYLKAFLDKVTARNPRLPCFCFGHSTGAAIILKAVLDPKVEAQVEGVVVTSPAVGVQPSHPIYTVVAPIVSFLVPRYQCGAANKKGAVVSRDPDALLAKYSDPLVYTGSLRVRTGYEILRISSYLQRNLSRLRVPFLLLHGTADTVTDPEASERMYQVASSDDKTIKLYHGLLHDLLFEPERDAITHDILDWLNKRARD